LTKAKSVDLMDQVVTTCSDINLPIQTVQFFRDLMGLDRVKEVKEVEAPANNKNLRGGSKFILIILRKVN
jgi:hypothetical protein